MLVLGVGVGVVVRVAVGEVDSRLPAQQHWPELVVNARSTFAAAASMSASGNTMLADLPPSSRQTGLRLDMAHAT